MGTYLRFKVKPGRANDVNALYRALSDANPDAFLVYSRDVIQKEIDFIHSPAGESQAHLRPYLRTVDDWGKIFPAYALNTGNIKLTGINPDDDVAPAVRQAIKVLRLFPEMFASIEGMEDAKRLRWVE